MDEDRIEITLTPAEARLVAAALRQFEPYWPAEADDRDRAAMLAGVRSTVDHVTDSLRPFGAPHR